MIIYKNMITKFDAVNIMRNYYGYINITIIDEENFVEAFKRFHKMATKYFNVNGKHKFLINRRYWDEINVSDGKIKSINDVVNVSYI